MIIPINIKRNSYFKPGDILLDPFAGSGTALVQANEMNMHGIGIDISQFNCMLARSKLHKYDCDALQQRNFPPTKDPEPDRILITTSMRLNRN